LTFLSSSHVEVALATLALGLLPGVWRRVPVPPLTPPWASDEPGQRQRTRHNTQHPSTSSPPHGTPIVSYYQPHYQKPYQHAHEQPTPSMHPWLNLHYHHAYHVHPQSIAHAHDLGFAPGLHVRLAPASPAHSGSWLWCTASFSSVNTCFLSFSSQSSTPSPRIATPPILDHAPHAYPHESAVRILHQSRRQRRGKRGYHRSRTCPFLQSKKAWGTMIHGSFV
jgi:hypothetical protein